MTTPTSSVRAEEDVCSYTVKNLTTFVAVEGEGNVKVIGESDLWKA
jgi:hypothetical protein